MSRALLPVFLLLLLLLPPLQAQNISLIVRPERKQVLDVPPYLAKDHPHEKMVLLTYIPINHPAVNGDQVLPGEGSRLDRGMRPLDPETIRFFLPEDNLRLARELQLTAAYQMTVHDSGDGYFDTVPLLSPDVHILGVARSINFEPDTELNRLYLILLQSNAKNPWYIAALRQAQRSWLRYRDARADLEGLIAGNGQLNLMAHAEEVGVLTRARIKNFQHYPLNGLPWDFQWVPMAQGYGNPELGGNPIQDRYNQYRQQLIDHPLPGILGKWIATQKAWTQFASDETNFESRQEVILPDGTGLSNGTPDQDLFTKAMVRLDHLRWADMNLTALELGLDPTLVQPTAPDVALDANTVVSDRGDLRVEVNYVGNSQKSVVYANGDNSYQNLADPNRDNDQSKMNYYNSDIFISPDSQWILAIQSATHSNREAKTKDAILYNVVKPLPIGLETVPGDGPSFGKEAFQHFHQPADWVVYLQFNSWDKNKLNFIYITGPDVEPIDTSAQKSYRCTYDLKKNTFSEPIKMDN